MDFRPFYLSFVLFEYLVMALNSATHTHDPTTSLTHTRPSKLDQTTLESLYRQGYQLDEIILRSGICVKCDSMSSCPGMLYTTTDKIYFISNSNMDDIGEFVKITFLRLFARSFQYGTYLGLLIQRSSLSPISTDEIFKAIAKPS